ncbi:LOW QUALITY PROTEIN: uncharacterized protein QC763_700260 [Podospora pseudopauciseta]|uniref:Uncharacterized protein n=1 Tax=Podospora pseudopauciseta TaxID=2093780 RepID=A0ABR0H393_9PEZI|nr:LOW QUALITY PROTEIN: hypothetical protein QC763_700260 [Podospora pseudopauciseta]
MATSMPEVGGGRKHWREAHTKEQPESSDMSDPDRKDSQRFKSPNPSPFFFVSLETEHVFVIYSAHCMRTGSVHVIIVAIRVSVMMQQTK